jgi:hypothetical protein
MRKIIGQKYIQFSGLVRPGRHYIQKNIRRATMSGNEANSGLSGID